MNAPLLDVRHLTTKFALSQAKVHAVNDASFSLAEGEIVLDGKNTRNSSGDGCYQRSFLDCGTNGTGTLSRQRHGDDWQRHKRRNDRQHNYLVDRQRSS